MRPSPKDTSVSPERPPRAAGRAHSASPRSGATRTLVRVAEPSVGANRREGLLLAAFAVLFLVGVWTVVVAELAPQEPAAALAPNVTPPTESQPSSRQ